MIHQNIRELLQEVAERSKDSVNQHGTGSLVGLTVSCVSVRANDDVVTEIFSEVLRLYGAQSSWIPAEALASEAIDLIGQQKADTVFLSNLPPPAVTQTRYLCKRIQSRLPQVHLVVGFWNQQGALEHVTERLRMLDEGSAVATFASAIERLQHLIPETQNQAPLAVANSFAKE